MPKEILVIFLKCIPRAIEIGQEAMALTTKTDEGSALPGVHMVEGKNRPFNFAMVISIIPQPC